jgi:hypothetical protein
MSNETYFKHVNGDIKQQKFIFTHLHRHGWSFDRLKKGTNQAGY